MKVFLVRHGETSWNKSGKIQGHTDVELTENGIKQAKVLRESETFKSIRFAKHVYCSDLMRARQTAEVLGQQIAGHQILETRAIRELYKGKFEGISYAEYKDAFLEWASRPEEVKWITTVADEESRWAALERILSFLESLLPPSNESSVSFDSQLDDTILVITHSGIIRVLYLHIMKYLPMDQVSGWENLGFLHIEIGKDRHDIRILEAEGVKLAKS
jgi:broad specificity phosphatase PhoE